MPVITIRSTSYGQSYYKRFDKIHTSDGENTIVKIRKNKNAMHTLTIEKVKWSKYKIINWFRKLFLHLKYH